jgi:hypothetical protein
LKMKKKVKTASLNSEVLWKCTHYTFQQINT